MNQKLQDIETAVRMLARDNPDFVYDSTEQGGCWYVRNHQFSCLIGQALGAVGFTTSQLSPHESQPASDVVSELLDLDNSDDNNRARRWLDYVQHYQDTQTDWASAVAEADRRIFGE